jgi:hypothetical protein
MSFEELDTQTRHFMLLEFDAEQGSANPYRGRSFTAEGIAASIAVLRRALEGGTEASLADALSFQKYWNPTELFTRGGVVRTRPVGLRQSAERFGFLRKA